jgi:hypothetical protein
MEGNGDFWAVLKVLIILSLADSFSESELDLLR